MSVCTEAELALKRRFEEVYARTIAPVMQEIEREVCGCYYSGNSWTTLEQADQLNCLLRLDAYTEFIDLGSGTGWRHCTWQIKAGVMRRSLIFLKTVFGSPGNGLRRMEYPTG